MLIAERRDCRMTSLTLSEWLTPSNFIAGAALIVAVTAVIVSMMLHDRGVRAQAVLFAPGIYVRASNSHDVGLDWRPIRSRSSMTKA